MHDYRRRSKADLVQFARQRGLRVQSTGKRATRPLKQNLIEALQDADANRQFRFLDLPPELRNMVYRELLSIKEPSAAGSSPTCHPQILRASKEVNEEASGILYGDNVIEIRVYALRVYAHGVRCGIYQPVTPPDAQQKPDRKSKHLVRPDFLRRAQSIRVIDIDTLSHPANQHHPPNTGTMHNMLFSLCLFLQENLSLRSVTVDFTWLTTRYVELGRLQSLQERLQTAVYPLRMLNRRVSASVHGIELIPLQQPLAPNLKAIELAQDIVEGSLRVTARHLQATLRTTFILLLAAGRPQGMPELMMLIGEAVSVSFAGFVFVLCSADPGELMKKLRDLLTHLRDEWDGAGADQVPATLRQQLDGVLMLGVEIEQAEMERRAG